jgi:uncharacterized membrane protein
MAAKKAIAPAPPAVPDAPPTSARPPAEGGRQIAISAEHGPDYLQFRVGSYVGPIPPAEFLSAIDQVVKNGAERAFAMQEREQSHRHDMDKRRLAAWERVRLIGIGSAIAFLLLGGVGVAFSQWQLGGGTAAAGLVAMAVMLLRAHEPPK